MLYTSHHLLRRLRWAGCVVHMRWAECVVHMRWAGCVVHVRKKKKTYYLYGRREGTRLLGNHRHRWEDNINIGFKWKAWKRGLDS